MPPRFSRSSAKRIWSFVYVSPTVKNVGLFIDRSVQAESLAFVPGGFAKEIIPDGGAAGNRALKDYAKRYTQFLERLKKAREESGLTQVEVAERLSQPQSYVSKCESGERRVDIVELEQFATLYRKRIDFFLL